MSKVMLATLATLLTAIGAGPAHADDSEICQKARSAMGAAAARDATPVQCQRALDSIEEERWQLWLDMALAAEQNNDREQAIDGYQRFVDAADQRGARLGEIWSHQRDDARTAIGRLDTELLQKRARVTISTVPEGADVTVVSGGMLKPGSTQKTPVVRYFTPGSHVIRLFSADTKASREVNFSVEAGQTLELKADLRPGAPTDYGVIEGTGPALRGQTPGKDTGDPGTTGGTSAVTVEVKNPDGTTTVSGGHGATNPEDDDDHEGPPQTSTHHSILRTLGVAAIAVGAASLAAGGVFLANGSGLDDEFTACAAVGSGCTGTASELNALEHEADVQYTRGTAALVAGGVLVVGGILALVLVDDEPQVQTTDHARVTPWLSPDGGGLSAALRF